MRVLHTMIRVGDQARSIRFYTEMLGMTLLRQQDCPDGKFTLAFVGYGTETEQTVIELMHNDGVVRDEMGSGFGHSALAVPNAYAACDAISQRGGRVVHAMGPMKHRRTAIAFVEAQNGYKAELIQKGAQAVAGSA